MNSEHRKLKNRFPRLIRLIMWVAILSENEALSALRGYLNNDEYTCEAVAHFGGATAVVERAAACRNAHARVRKAVRQ